MTLRVSEEELRALFVKRLEVVDQAEFDKARALATRLRVPLDRALVERGRIPLGFLLQQLADDWGVGFIDLKVSDVMPEALSAVPEDYARGHKLIPFGRSAAELRVAMVDPRDGRAVDEIGHTTKLKVVPFLSPDTAIARAHLLYRPNLRAMLERTLTEETSLGPMTRGSEESSATDLLTQIIEYAAVTRASDIHIEPYELEALVRCRIDGVLREVLSLTPALLPSLVARIKILGSMRIDERRAPQDGRFESDLGGFKLDMRVSTMPTHWGEKTVLRVLTKETILLDLEDLGLSPADYEVVVRNVLKPYGMVLITGPTGSGKSTSLYAMLIRVGVERQNVVNISTVEDPVEYTIPRINQTAVNPAAGVEFATGLRALLRQDPDVIMVGEIRDRDTVEIAVRAALVGRMVLSTLHTNNATGSVPRLLDMGVEPYLVASTLTLVVAQRLVRRICTNCRESFTPGGPMLGVLRRLLGADRTVEVLRDVGVLTRSDDPLSGVRLYRGRGCAQCGGSGFRGRLGVFELFELDDQARSMIMQRQDAAAIREAAIKRGMKTIFQDGLAKAFLGGTTIEEIFRVAM